MLVPGVSSEFCNLVFTTREEDYSLDNLEHEWERENICNGGEIRMFLEVKDNLIFTSLVMINY